MPPTDWYPRWWLSPGEVVAQLGTAALIFESDSGTLWTFSLRTPGQERRLRWDHQARGFVGRGLEELDSDTIAIVRDLLHTMVGPPHDWVLRGVAQHVVDTIAEAMLDDEWITGRRLRVLLDKMKRKDFDPIAGALQPRYLRAREGDSGDGYSLTLPGLWVSSQGPLVRRILDATIATLKSKFATDPDFRTFTLDEVVETGGFDDGVRRLIVALVSICGLMRGGTGGGSGREYKYAWGTPSEIEDIVCLNSVEDLFRFFQEHPEPYSVRCWPTTPIRPPLEHVAVSSEHVHDLHRGIVEIELHRPKAPPPTSATASNASRASTSNVDVLVIIALKEELDALLDVTTGVVEPWREGPEGEIPHHLATLKGRRGPIRVAAARLTRMGGVATATAATRLAELLTPGCLAMCGVCAGHPEDTDLGDVILADRVFHHDQGKLKAGGLEGDLWVHSLSEAWLRAAQDRAGPAEGLHGYAAGDDEAGQWWFLEQLLDGRNPMRSSALRRHVPDARRTAILGTLRDELGYVTFTEGAFRLTDAGRNASQERRAFYGTFVTQQPYHIHVGPMGSGNAVVANGTIWDRLAANHAMRKILAVEMEAASVGQVAHERSLPFVVVKGVMDHADQGKTDRFKGFAARVSAEVLCDFLRRVVIATAPRKHAMRCTWVEFAASAKLGGTGEACPRQALDPRHGLCSDHLDQAVAFAREHTGLDHASLDGAKDRFRYFIAAFLAGAGLGAGMDAWETLKAFIVAIIEILRQPMAAMQAGARPLPQELPLEQFRELLDRLAPEGMDPALVDRLTTIEFRDATVELVNELVARGRIVRASDLR